MGTRLIRYRVRKTVVVIVLFALITLYIIATVGISDKSLSTETTHSENTHTTTENNEEHDIFGTGKLVKTYYNQTIVPPGVILRSRGGIGNQLFHYACSYALARRKNLPLYIDHYQPESSENSRKFYSYQREFALDKFQIPLNNFITLGKTSTTKLSPGSKIQLVSDKDLIQGKFNNANNSHLFYQQSGECQSDLYWKGFNQEIQEMFQLDLQNGVDLSKIEEFLALVKETESVAVHVRRGDFLRAAGGAFAHPISYQKSAIWQMANILEKRKTGKRQLFFVFSDDIDYTKKKFKTLAKHHEFVYVSGQRVKGTLVTSIEEFYLMTMCKHIIFPNSTFSWWAAYLNRNKRKVVIGAAFDNYFYNLRKNRTDAKFEREMHQNGFHLKDWIVINPFVGNLPMGNINSTLFVQ